MGIKDLLKFMKPHIEPIHIKKYAGKRVGIDAYSWLHKGAYSCSMEICLDSKGDKKLRYIDYFMHRINLLRFYKITPVVVFDGGNIPCKAATEHERYRRREANRELAMEKLKEGNVDAASELFQRAVSITPFMAHQLIQILRSENVEFVVAPYEADAQLAYLSSMEAEKNGIAAVITEDSDLLAYGCQATIFKMDRYGNGEEMVLAKVFDAMARKPSFLNLDEELFMGMCVLAGCDFLPSVPGIGIVKAHSFVSKYRDLDRVLSVLKLEKGSQMPEDYPKSFREALAVFQYARIYDSNTKTLKHIKPLSPNILEYFDGKLDFLGPEIPPSIATAIAEGKLNPTNMEAFDCFPTSGCHPDTVVIQSSRKLQKPEAAAVSREKSCFVGFSSLRTVEKDITDLIVKQDPETTETRYINEALALHKLISQPEVEKNTKREVVSIDVPLKVPNNPFMIGKLEIHLNQIQCDSEQFSEVTEDEKSYKLCITPDNISSKVPDVSLSKKRKLNIYLDQQKSITEQDSLVSEVEDPDIFCVTKESQESVHSKPKISNRKSRGKSEKPKKSNHSSAENKKSTILNFFSRV